MKKIIKCLALFLFVLVISGCNSKLSYKESVCTLENDQSKSDYKAQTTYKIYSKNDIVKKVYSKETLKSNSKEILDYFKNLYEKQYDAQNKNYGGYKYSIKIDGNNLISDITIDYTKLDLDKFIKDNSAMKSYVNEENKLTVDGIIKMYESLGASCK